MSAPIKEISVIFEVIRSTAAKSGPIVGIMDHFGKAYRCFRSQPILGKVYKSNMLDDEREFENTSAFIPLNKVHINSVKAILRRRKEFAQRALRKGHWYEVSGE